MIAIVIMVKDGDRIIQNERFVLMAIGKKGPDFSQSGLKTAQEMKKYRQVTYQPGLYYDKQSGTVVDRDSQLEERAYMNAVQTKLKEEIINSNAFLRSLRRGR